MTMWPGRIAYEVYAQRLRDRNLPTVLRPHLPHWKAEAWQEVGETIARHCGVDPAVFGREVGSTPEPREASERSGDEPTQ